MAIFGVLLYAILGAPGADMLIPQDERNTATLESVAEDVDEVAGDLESILAIVERLSVSVDRIASEHDGNGTSKPDG